MSDSVGVNGTLGMAGAEWPGTAFDMSGTPREAMIKSNRLHRMRFLPAVPHGETPYGPFVHRFPHMTGSSSVTEDAGASGMKGASIMTDAQGSVSPGAMTGATCDALIPTLILFTRVPKAGQAKTRLIPALGEQGAAEFQWYLLERLLGELRRGVEQGLWQLRVYYCGTEGLERLRAMAGEGVAFVEQAGNPDLGVRMRAALERELAAGASAVGLMGSDLPEAMTGVVAEALDLLKDPATDVSLCPVEDGGYWFVGLKRPFSQLFEGATYGGSSVFEDALAACAVHGRTVAAGPRLRDVDTPEDLAWFEDWAAGSGARTAPAV